MGLVAILLLAGAVRAQAGDLLKAQGYMRGQFGKNHLGDQEGHLPTAHGFDEFFGSLYHLNAEDEPENPDYGKDPELRKLYAGSGGRLMPSFFIRK